MVKFQITNSKSQTNSKFQIQNSKPVLVIGILVIGACLEFGAWDL